MEYTADGSVWVLHKNGELSFVKNDTIKSLGYKHDTILSLTKSEDEVFALTKQSVIALKSKKSKYKNLLSNKQILNIQGDNVFAYSHDSLICISAKGRTLLTVDYFDKKQQVLTINGKHIALGQRSITVLKDQTVIKKIMLPNDITFGKVLNGNLFVGTASKLIEYKITENITLVNEYGFPLDRQNFSISDVIFDKEKTLWISTKGGGVFKLPKEHFPLLEGKAVSLTQVSAFNNTPRLVYDNQVVELGEQNKMLYRHYTSGLNCYYKKSFGEQWIGEKSGLSIIVPGAAFAYAFKEMRGKNIIDVFPYGLKMVVVTSKTIYAYNPANNGFEKFIDDPKFEPYTTIKKDSIVYIMGKGNVYKVDENGIQPFFSESYDEIKNLTFTSLAIKNKKFYLGTLEKGIIEYTKGLKPTFIYNEDFPSEQIISLGIIDNQFWCATPIGLVKMNLEKRTYDFYDQSYFNNINFISTATISIDNKLYMPANEGLIEINPYFFVSSDLPDVNLESFLANGEFVSLSTDKSFPYNEKPLSFSFSSNSLKSEVYYQYRLLGLDSTWSDPTNQKSIVYSRLPAGEYTFQVRTASLNSNSVGKILEQTFSINLPIYKTAGFWIVIILIILGVVFLYYFTRIIRLRKQRKLLKEEVERKTFELSAEKKKIEQFSYSLSHDLKNPINNIKGLVEIMEENQSGEDVVKMLSDAANQLETKISRSLDAIKKVHEKSSVKPINIKDKLEEVEKSLLFLIKGSKATIEKDIRVETFIQEDTLLESILYNLISNAIKYKHPERKPIIEIKTDRVGEFKRIHILDNGIGIDLKKEDDLFSIFKRVNEQKDVEGTGLGLYMIKQMIELRGGKIEVESQPQLGSKFLVYLKDLKD